MNNTKHTPGPWHIGPTNQPHEISDVPNIVLNLPSNDAVYITGTNREANARLIAAAPELLELAKHILALETDPYLQGHPEWETFLNEAKAVITKTEPIKQQTHAGGN